MMRDEQNKLIQELEEERIQTFVDPILFWVNSIYKFPIRIYQIQDNSLILINNFYLENNRKGALNLALADNIHYLIKPKMIDVPFLGKRKEQEVVFQGSKFIKRVEDEMEYIRFNQRWDKYNIISRYLIKKKLPKSIKSDPNPK